MDLATDCKYGKVLLGETSRRALSVKTIVIIQCAVWNTFKCNPSCDAHENEIDLPNLRMNVKRKKLCHCF